MILDSALWVRVIDVSHHQGNIDFARMRATGIWALILRVSNGQTIDDRYASYYAQAVVAGFDPRNICVYTFINPKRGTGAQCATATLDAIRDVVGHTDVGYMLDVENYRNESPNVGQAPVYGAAFAAHIREHINTVHQIAPGANVFGYSNRAYWNGPVVGLDEVWVGDDQLASELEWLAARYPAYSDAAYARMGYPPLPAGWPDWAFKAQPVGPLPPRGGKWWGWQFSAGFNKQGPVYATSSTDLDLNIVHPDAWARWTTTPPIPPTPIPGDDDMATVTFEVTGLPGLYMWTPGSDPIPFTDVPNFQNLSTGLVANALTAPLLRDMYDRLFTKPVSVSVPPITVPPVTVTFPNATTISETTWTVP